MSTAPTTGATAPPVPAAAPAGPTWAQRAQTGLTRNPLLVLLVVMVVALQVSTGSALAWPNLRGVLLDAAVIAVVAVPSAVLVICGYIDLSVGSTLALGGVVAGKVMAGGDGNPVVAVVLAVALGALVGLVNGVLSTHLGLSSFIVTLGSLTAVRGAAQLVSPLPVNTFGDAFGFLGVGTLAGVPLAVWLAVVALVVAGVVLTCTPVGRHVYAIGVNREAAFLSGVSVRRVPLVVFVLSGAAAAFAGVVTVARLNSAPAGQLGLGFELQVLTAVLLGGVALTGGEGGMFGVAIGVLFLGVLRNGLTLLDVTTFWQSVASGLALVAAIALARGTHAVRRRLEAAAAARAADGPPDAAQP
ncbi:ABC transporter permease [Kineococcus sp. SYSU DK001]|uniref:ABC transporter permease n=1 Tax=Kineococcus sp. SYSU DK001 TaxID=3383122 RepID=UPI003D7C7A7B